MLITHSTSPEEKYEVEDKLHLFRQNEKTPGRESNVASRSNLRQLLSFLMN
jgi:hypothetical protein